MPVFKDVQNTHLIKNTALALCCLLIIVSNFKPASAADPDNLVLTVLRDGDPIGTQKFSFKKDGDKLIVNSSMHTKVDKMFITFYRHDFDSEEVWQDGQLVSFESKTNDNGDDYNLTMQRNGDALEVDCNGKKWTVPATEMIVSLWNKDILKKNQLLSALHGQPYKGLSVRDAGEEIITVKGQPIPAHRYAMTGDLERDLWYDQNGQLVKVAFMKKGSKIEYVRE